MTCNEAQEEISSYCDHEISAVREVQLCAHLRLCRKCSAELASFRRLNSFLEITDPAGRSENAVNSIDEQCSAFDRNKRIFDIAVGVALLVIASPFMLLIAITLAVCSPGPIITKHERVGKGEMIFDLYRFRTTRMGIAPDTFALPLKKRTLIGMILRGLKLDRLPEIWNVIRGDMSIVGPTAFRPQYAALFRREDKVWIYSVRPGLTGQTQLRFRYERHLVETQPEKEEYYRSVLLPIKCLMEATAVQERGAWTDTKIIIKSFLVLLRVNHYVFIWQPRQKRQGNDARRLLYAQCINLVLPSALSIVETEMTYWSPDACAFKTVK